LRIKEQGMHLTLNEHDDDDDDDDDDDKRHFTRRPSIFIQLVFIMETLLFVSYELRRKKQLTI